jgi:hypothetical protein
VPGRRDAGRLADGELDVETAPLDALRQLIHSLD